MDSFCRNMNKNLGISENVTRLRRNVQATIKHGNWKPELGTENQNSESGFRNPQIKETSSSNKRKLLCIAFACKY